jgi:hypothetical protein
MPILLSEIDLKIWDYLLKLSNERGKWCFRAVDAVPLREEG